MWICLTEKRKHIPNSTKALRKAIGINKEIITNCRSEILNVESSLFIQRQNIL